MISKVLAGVLCFSSFAFAQEVKVEIPYQKFVLPNGLTLLVHEDRKAPIVAVNVWYHVGSKNEVRGRTGFAHLFEHLMFNGTEHNNNDYFKVLEKLGATDLNGTTNEDRTNYFQNVPTNALDTVLWMESDRMGHLVGVIDQARLDEQRGVVQNEKRQGENEPYGMVDLLSYEYSFPSGHPYSWSVIGSMDDLNAASLKDVKEWFAKYYGPTNATIVLAGDIDAKTAKEKVEKYFGHIPPGPPLQRPEQWIAKRTGNKKVSLQDRVPQARLYRMWNVPPSDTTELTRLRLFSAILGGGKTSRLYKRLVYRDQIATDASSGIDTREIASILTVEATARPGLDLTAVEAALSEEIHDLLTNGPTAEEVKRAQTQFVSNFVRGTERIGGFGGKSDLLAQGQVYAGNPEYYKTVLKDVQSATPADLKQVANAWLADGALDFEVVPYHEYKATTTDADRSKVPEPGPISDSRFPKLERTTLANGLKIVLAERHDTPIVSLVLAVDAGYAADQLSTPGTAKLTASMLEEGTRTRNAIQISEELEGLGARLSARANLDTSMVSMSALKVNLDPSLDLFADVILNPSFPETDLARERKQLLAGIARAGGTSTDGTAAAAIVPLRRRPRLRKSADRLGHRGFDQGDHAGSAGRIPSFLVPSEQRHADRGGRHDPGRNEAEAREGLRLLGARAGPGEESRQGIAAGQVRGVPDGQAGVAPVGDLRLQRRAASGRPERDCLADPQHFPGRSLRLAIEHEPARGQTLVLWLVFLNARRPRAASVHRHSTGPDRQDEGVDGGDEQGVS